MKYRLVLDRFDKVSETMIICEHEDGSVSSIPFVEENKEYQEYKKWLEEGNTPEPPFIPPVPPPPPEPTPEEKMAASGLTVDELKQLLGLS